MSYNVPFENSNYSLWQGWVTSLKMLIINPYKFFNIMHVNKGLFKPLFFAVIMVLIASFSHIFFTTFGIIPTPSEVLSQLPNQTVEVEKAIKAINDFYDNKLLLLSLLFFSNILFFIIGGILYHFLLSLLGIARNGLEATLRIVYYSSAGLIFTVIPLGLSSFLILMSIMRILFEGIKEAHEQTLSKTVMATMTPTLFIFLLALIMSSLS